MNLEKIKELNELGLELYENGKFGEAIKAFSQIVDSNPEDFDANYNLGITYYMLNDVIKSAQYMIEAYKLNSNVKDLVVNLSCVLSVINKKEEALIILKDFYSNNKFDMDIKKMLDDYSTENKNPNTITFYDKLYNGVWENNGFSQSWSYEDKSRKVFYDKIISQSFFPKNGRTLDVGCGMGGLFSAIENKNDYEFYGIDFSKVAIEKTSSRIEGIFVQGDVHNLPYKDNLFDNVICMETLEHVDNVKQVITEMKRVLKPMGNLLITVPEQESDLPAENWPGGVSFHVNVFTMESLSNIVKEVGLESNVCQVVDGIICFAATKSTVCSKKIEICKLSLNTNIMEKAKSIGAELLPKNPDNQEVKPIYDELFADIKNHGLKFMQISNFYDTYLNKVYVANPSLAGQKYESQIAALENDFFGGGHIYTPYLRKIGYDCCLVIANAMLAQTAWLRDNGLSYGGDNKNYDIVRMQIDSFKPDILYIIDPVMFDSKFIKTLKHRPKFIFGFRAQIVREDNDWSDFDLILSSHNFMKPIAERLNAKDFAILRPAFPSQVVNHIASIIPQYDVVFVGQLSGLHNKRVQYVKSLIDYFNLNTKYSLAIFSDLNNPILSNTGRNIHLFEPVFGLDYYRTLKKGKINLNFHADIAGSESGNMRLFETTGCGSFLLTDYFDNVDSMFKIGEELDTFRSENEMIEKIEYYLFHDEERELIAKAGQQRCLKDYSMNQNTIKLEKLIKVHCTEKNNNLDKSPGYEQEKKESILDQYFNNVAICQSVQMLGIKNIEIGEGTVIGDDVWLNVAYRDERKRLKIGKSVLIGRRNVLSSGGCIEIGDYCIFAPNVYISDTDHLYDNIEFPVVLQGVTKDRNVVIEENCWLGINVVVTGNLTIGRGSVVAANSVVITDIPPFCLVAGSPCRIVKMYNPQSKKWEKVKNKEQISEMINIREKYRIPTRDEYRKTLFKNAGLFVYPKMFGGNLESI